VSARALEAAFRHKLLLAIPFLVILSFAVTVSWMSRSKEYIATGRVWVERAQFLNADVGTDWNPYLTPAQNQSLVLNELMGTDDFARKVAERAGLTAPDGLAATGDSAQSVNLAGEGSGLDEETVLQRLRDDTGIGASGTHVIAISNRSPSALTAAAVVQSIIDEYADLHKTRTIDQAKLATSYYEERLASTQQELDKATTEANSYLAKHPELQAPEAPSLVGDATYIQLQSAVQRAETDYNSIQGTLAQIQFQSSATLQGLDSTFQVVDAPKPPSSPAPASLRSLLMLPALGALAALGLSSGLFFLLLRLDDAVRRPEEILSITGSEVACTIPDLRISRKRRWPREFVRLAVGIMAGLGPSKTTLS